MRIAGGALSLAAEAFEGTGFKVKGLGFRVSFFFKGPSLFDCSRVSGLGFRVLGFRVLGVGVRRAYEFRSLGAKHLGVRDRV